MLTWIDVWYDGQILDTVQMYEDWHRQVRYKNEKDIRMKLADLNTVKGKINSVKFNIKKKELSNKLDIILR